jgi:hypothetical protein
VQLGLHEKRTGIVCLGLHAFCCGAKLWEEKHPEVAQARWELAERHAQQDQIKADNGPQSNGRRTQFLKRIVEFADHIGKCIRLLYYPALSQQIQSGGALPGNPGKALKRCQAHRRPNDAGVGQEHDLERRSSRRRTERHGLSKRNHRGQGCHAICQVQAGTKPTPTQVGHLNPTRLNGINIRRDRLRRGMSASR